MRQRPSRFYRGGTPLATLSAGLLKEDLVRYSTCKWPCRIGVVSDTHISDASGGRNLLASFVATHFGDADLVLHAGDLTDPSVLSLFGCCPVLAVRGNMDPGGSDLPMRRVIEAGPFRIGLVHGWGAPVGLEQRVIEEFAAEDIDCLVYGHSHQPVCRRHGGLLLFNPGSPVDRRDAAFHSLGFLEVADTIEGRIVPLD